MKVYTYSEARQQLATLLEEAARTGSVLIRRKDGQFFVLRPEPPSRSPLDVPGVPLGLGREEIVNFIHKGRRDLGEPG
jgi:antitoxin Phd